MTQMFKLTNEPGGLGLSCTHDGLSLAGVPLLSKTGKRFAPRSTPEVDALLGVGKGEAERYRKLRSNLDLIAEALNRDDLAYAGIAAVLTATPELSRAAAARLAETHERLAKYSPDQPRDGRGRWTRGEDGGPSSSSATTPSEFVAATPSQGDSSRDSDDGSSAPEAQGGSDAPLAPSSPAEPGVPGDRWDDAPAVASGPLTQKFEQKYDDLHPVDFAKAVLQFGYRLETEGHDLPPAEKAEAVAEYSFLEDRLSFWLAYEYTPPDATGNLRSAALALYRGAVQAGIATPGGMPQSMLAVAAETAFYNNAPPPRLGIPPQETFELPVRVPGERPPEPDGLGGTVDNSKAKIVWGAGNEEQGKPMETLVANQDPSLEQLPPNSKTFDLINRDTGAAVSAKTLNTLSVSYIRNPRSIYSRLSGYIDAAADYEGGGRLDLQPDEIQSKTVQLAVPDYTSSTQWRYLHWAILYGKERDVSVVITRIRN